MTARRMGGEGKSFRAAIHATARRNTRNRKVRVLPGDWLMRVKGPRFLARVRRCAIGNTRHFGGGGDAD